MSSGVRRTAQWEKWRGIGIGVAAIVCGTALIWALFGPGAVWLARHDIGTAKGSVLETALQNARSAYLTLAAGILAAGALVYTARNHRLSREGQVTDRYTKAIEQLGSDKPGVRIGGIFALERIALDSPRDHPTVMEVLSAFLREQSASSSPRGSLALFLSGQSSSRGNMTPAAQAARPPDIPQDIRAAITVIARRNDSRDDFQEGQGLDLEGARLVRANLTSAPLANANLSNAVLHEAKMDRIDLLWAILANANLIGTNLREADLRYANLRGANLQGAHMDGANLNGAYLEGANLNGATLRSANLRSSHLDGTDMDEADLHGALWLPAVAPPAGWQRGSNGKLQPVLRSRGST